MPATIDRDDEVIDGLEAFIAQPNHLPLPAPRRHLSLVPAATAPDLDDDRTDLGGDEPAPQRPRAVHLARVRWDARDMGAVWAAHHDGDRTAREHLIVHHQRLVTAVAAGLHRRLGRHHELADLVSAGVFGLIDAIDRYDPSQVATFEPYAKMRIRGSILDELRHMDWAPRTLRATARDIEAARVELEADLHRHPTRAEVAAHLGVSEQHVTQAVAGAEAARVNALDYALGDGTGTLADTIAQPGADPAERIDDLIDTALMSRAFTYIPCERTKLVLVLHYFERMSTTEIGSILGVTSSRISQMHHAGLAAMRRVMDPSLAA